MTVIIKKIRAICPVVIFASAVIFLFTSDAEGFDSGYPEEPERFDSEYYLDLLTMRADREWRALEDRTDNIFSLDFGSLNVEQWVLLQSLKFSSPLSENFRFRYWLVNDHGLGRTGGERNELEIEWNFSEDYYLSFYLQPTFWKRENDIGVGIQSRDAVDSYRRLIFRVRDFANNFAYRHGDNIEGEENIYTRQPLELVLEVLDRTGTSFRYGASAVFSSRWEKQYRFTDSPEDDYTAEGYRRQVEGWLERDISERFIICLDAGYAEYFSGSEGNEEEHIITELLPRLWYFPVGRGYSGGNRLAFCGGASLRREWWERKGAEAGEFEKDEFLPFISARYRVSQAHLLEAGYLADRYESERSGAGSNLRWENRLKIVWEIRLNSRARFRIIETLDLDREDWGQFSVHDHFFLMSRVIF